MNERIEKLALQAGMHRDKFGMYFAGDKHDEDGVDLEKFAELIIRECVNTLEFHGFDDAVPYIKWMATNKLGVEE